MFEGPHRTREVSAGHSNARLNVNLVEGGRQLFNRHINGSGAFKKGCPNERGVISAFARSPAKTVLALLAQVSPMPRRASRKRALPPSTARDFLVDQR